ncbi:MAG: hypothetical protein NTY23_12420 [Chloroflexi bacterium]|nr:hypothetical protein [Chloroflexota bacterium]
MQLALKGCSTNDLGQVGTWRIIAKHLSANDPCRWRQGVDIAQAMKRKEIRCTNKTEMEVRFSVQTARQLDAGAVSQALHGATDVSRIRSFLNDRHLHCCVGVTGGGELDGQARAADAGHRAK